MPAARRTSFASCCFSLLPAHPSLKLLLLYDSIIKTIDATLRWLSRIICRPSVSTLHKRKLFTNYFLKIRYSYVIGFFFCSIHKTTNLVGYFFRSLKNSIKRWTRLRISSHWKMTKWVLPCKVLIQTIPSKRSLLVYVSVCNNLRAFPQSKKGYIQTIKARSINAKTFPQSQRTVSTTSIIYSCSKREYFDLDIKQFTFQISNFQMQNRCWFVVNFTSIILFYYMSISLHDW